jgi:hypothetical protein
LVHLDRLVLLALEEMLDYQDQLVMMAGWELL